MKLLVLSLCLLFASFCCFSQTETSQMVFPRKIHVGDIAELRYTFQSNVDFFPNEDSVSEKNLFLNRLPLEFDNEDFTITKAVIQRNALQYTVVFTFSAWKVGQIDFPQFDLLSAVFGSDSSVPFNIDPEPFEVVSILPKGDDTSLRGIAGPLLVPGTVYVIYAVILLAVVLLILILHTIIRWQAISAKIKERELMRLYAKNARGALRQFRKLEKKSSKINDASFCMAIQQIFRFYLTTRFDRRFDTLSSGQLKEVFKEISGDSYTEFLEETADSLSRIFYRADYIRFAQGSLDSKKSPREKFATELQPDERNNLIASCRNIIKAFETGGQNA